MVLLFALWLIILRSTNCDVSSESPRNQEIMDSCVKRLVNMTEANGYNELLEYCYVLKEMEKEWSLTKGSKNCDIGNSKRKQIAENCAKKLLKIDVTLSTHEEYLHYCENLLKGEELKCKLTKGIMPKGHLAFENSIDDIIGFADSKIVKRNSKGPGNFGSYKLGQESPVSSATIFSKRVYSKQEESSGRQGENVKLRDQMPLSSGTIFSKRVYSKQEKSLDGKGGMEISSEDRHSQEVKTTGGDGNLLSSVKLLGMDGQQGDMSKESKRINGGGFQGLESKSSGMSSFKKVSYNTSGQGLDGAGMSSYNKGLYNTGSQGLESVYNAGSQGLKRLYSTGSQTISKDTEMTSYNKGIYNAGVPGMQGKETGISGFNKGLYSTGVQGIETKDTGMSTFNKGLFNTASQGMEAKDVGISNYNKGLFNTASQTIEAKDSTMSTFNKGLFNGASQGLEGRTAGISNFNKGLFNTASESIETKDSTISTYNKGLFNAGSQGLETKDTGISTFNTVKDSGMSTFNADFAAGKGDALATPKQGRQGGGLLNPGLPPDTTVGDQALEGKGATLPVPPEGPAGGLPNLQTGQAGGVSTLQTGQGLSTLQTGRQGGGLLSELPPDRGAGRSTLQTGQGSGLSTLQTGQGGGLLPTTQTGQGQGMSTVETGQSQGLSTLQTGKGGGLPSLQTGQGQGLSTIQTSQGQVTGQGGGLSNIQTAQGQELSTLQTGQSGGLPNLQTGQVGGLPNLQTGMSTVETGQSTQTQTGKGGGMPAVQTGQGSESTNTQTQTQTGLGGGLPAPGGALPSTVGLGSKEEINQDVVKGAILSRTKLEKNATVGGDDTGMEFNGENEDLESSNAVAPTVIKETDESGEEVEGSSILRPGGGGGTHLVDAKKVATAAQDKGISRQAMPLDGPGGFNMEHIGFLTPSPVPFPGSISPAMLKFLGLLYPSYSQHMVSFIRSFGVSGFLVFPVIVNGLLANYLIFPVFDRQMYSGYPHGAMGASPGGFNPAMSGYPIATFDMGITRNIYDGLPTGLAQNAYITYPPGLARNAYIPFPAGVTQNAYISYPPGTAATANPAPPAPAQGIERKAFPPPTGKDTSMKKKLKPIKASSEELKKFMPPVPGNPKPHKEVIDSWKGSGNPPQDKSQV